MEHYIKYLASTTLQLALRSVLDVADSLTCSDGSGNITTFYRLINMFREDTRKNMRIPVFGTKLDNYLHENESLKNMLKKGFETDYPIEAFQACLCRKVLEEIIQTENHYCIRYCTSPNLDGKFIVKLNNSTGYCKNLVAYLSKVQVVGGKVKAVTTYNGELVVQYYDMRSLSKYVSVFACDKHIEYLGLQSAPQNRYPMLEIVPQDINGHFSLSSLVPFDDGKVRKITNMVMMIVEDCSCKREIMKAAITQL
ncbi:hypothetical protein Cgig2_019702 [Carnegiea gigantea]|uniref:Uncharacterized protein n=1 Tax=Carnegiea gigantea TaxID=171969 RepID=A0A9Q1QLV2_9CARY|nr:hypothetical protein Cgig2_019702 [Carnegiea gigantea]